MAETIELSDEILSIIFNLSLQSSEGDIRESSANLISSNEGIKKRYEKFKDFVKEFGNTYGRYSLIIDWALRRHTGRENAVLLLTKIGGNSIYTDYLISCLKNVYLDFDGEHYREMMGDVWEVGGKGTFWKDGKRTDVRTYPKKEKEVFDVITKKAEDGQTYGLDPFDYLVDSIYEAFDVYFDQCKIMVEVLKTITTFQSDRSLKLLENLLEEKGGDSPIYGQMENAIVILSGGQGKDWNSFDLNFGVYL